MSSERNVIWGGMVMSRKGWFLASAVSGSAVLVGAAFVAGLAILTSSGPAGAQGNRSDGKDGEAARGGAGLPIGQIVLFSSGVGYFQREGTVEGNARVDLSFDVRDINDLIKSMVLRDLDGGVVTAVSYDSNAPVERTLKSFA